jgi:hypothetical protein
MAMVDITGQKFSRLTVLKLLPERRRRLAVWLCQCDCGQEAAVTGESVRRGNTRSCGCLQRETSRKTNSARAHKDRDIKECLRRLTKKSRSVEFVRSYLMTHPCVDCGEADPIVLDFDHRPSSKKIKNISRLSVHGRSIKAIQSEIDKCDVRCANCHRRMTHKRRQEVGFKPGPSPEASLARLIHLSNWVSPSPQVPPEKAQDACGGVQARR